MWRSVQSPTVASHRAAPDVRLAYHPFAGLT
jgi:hypothetical protein